MKMRSKSVVVLMIAACAILAVGLLGVIAQGSSAEPTPRNWLSLYEGGPVHVDFMSYGDQSGAPKMTTKALLVHAEDAGVVLRLAGQNEKFFPYAHILSISPR